MLKIFGGPRPPQEVVSARLKEARGPKINYARAFVFKRWRLIKQEGNSGLTKQRGV